MMKQTQKQDENSQLVDTDSSTFTFAASAFEETIIILKLYIPVVLQYVFIYFPTLIANIFIGHLPNYALLMAGSALGRSFTEVTGTAVTWGLNNTLKTLIPQAIGNNNQQLIAIYFQRSIIINVITNIPLSIIQFYAGTLMCAIDEPFELCSIVSDYCRILIPFIWLCAIFTTLQVIGQSIKLNNYIFLSTFISAVLAIPLNYLFVFTLDLGYIGTAITIDICILISCLISIVVICQNGYGFIFKPLPLSIVCTFDGIKQYLSLAIPSLISTLSTWISAELVVLLAGYVVNSDVAVASSSIIYGFDLMAVMLSVAANASVSIRVGKYIGAKSIKYAKRSFYCGFFVTSMFSLILLVIIFLFNDKIPLLWGISASGEILYYSSALFYMEAAKIAIWGAFHCLFGLLLGVGLPKYVAITVFITMWCINLPLVFITLFTFKWKDNTMYGLMAVWGSPILCRLLSVFMLLFITVYYIDFKSVINKSTMRIESTLKEYGSFNNNSVNIKKRHRKLSAVSIESV